MKVIMSVPDEGYYERTWWRLFQKRVVCTKFDVYAFISKTAIHHRPVSDFFFFFIVEKLQLNHLEFDWNILQTDVSLFLYISSCSSCSSSSPTVVSNHFHSVKILLFSSARLRDFDGLIGIELPVSMYTTKTPIDMCRFNVRSST